MLWNPTYCGHSSVVATLSLWNPAPQGHWQIDQETAQSFDQNVPGTTTLDHTSAMKMNIIWKIIYSNCGERYEVMIHHHSYTHNLNSYEMKAWKKFRPEQDSNLWPRYCRDRGLKSCSALNNFSGSKFITV